MILKSALDLPTDGLFLEVRDILPATMVQLKLEGLVLSGSIKVKPAIHMLAALEQSGRLRRGMHVIESSSGNLGLALSMACAVKGYRFTCVSDKNISPQTARLIETYGARLIVVREPDSNGGFLGTRIALIKSMLEQDRSAIWINQYENEHNAEAHYLSTGPELLAAFPAPDFVFVGAGTTGTLGGVSRYLRQYAPACRIVAVDTAGSVTFGGPPGKRRIPGLGTSQPPAIRALSSFDQLLMVPEEDTIRMCHALARRGLLLGGSSGTVLCGVQRYAARIPAGACVVAIAPDMGDRYVDTIYNPEWLRTHFPALAASQPCTSAQDLLEQPC